VIAIALAVVLTASAPDPDSSLWGATETVVAAGTAIGYFAVVPFDQAINRWAIRDHSPAGHVWAAGAKAVGDGYLTIPVSGALWFLGDRADMPRLARASRNALQAWCLTQLQVQFLKYAFHRGRPSESETNQDWYGPGITDRHLSFPSGHSASAWGLLPAFAMEFDDQPILVAALYATAASTSASRVHDGQHWTSDVLFSAGVGYLTNRLVRSWHRKNDRRMVMVPVIGSRLQGVTVVSSF